MVIPLEKEVSCHFFQVMNHNSSFVDALPRSQGGA